jgi:pyrroloquinoline quinone biosynthesis protein B
MPRLYLRTILSLLLVFALAEGNAQSKHRARATHRAQDSAVSLIILGTIQDGGSPHIGCTKACCKPLFEHPDANRRVVCLGLIDKPSGKTYLFEATPDIATQAKSLKAHAPVGHGEMPDGIFLTHAHIGHYAGLMYLGKEAINANGVPVYAMPRMRAFLEQNGPWSQLVKQQNIALQDLTADREIRLSPTLSVRPITVPHRDEFSETVGYLITGAKKKVLFIPDIDKWEKWQTDIRAAIAGVDYAFIDGTFYDAAEISNRDISTIPHPFIIESMKRFADLPPTEKRKVWFIHFNHTNPLIRLDSKEYRQVVNSGYHVARMGSVLEL